ncbi:MAG: hypothetical protein QM619_08920 [Micropruina sp.]|uniref:hypothetical protein n=1 Tax=Micropruina sp. TaxID=2737536 RepID=UPI0039E69ABA
MSHETRALVRKQPDLGTSVMGDEVQTSSERERRSLDLVQRTVVSLIVGGVIGKVAIILALYVITRGKQELPADSIVGLWIMSAVIGLVGAIAVLIINRRKPYHPLALLGLLPALATAYWVFN